MKPLLIVLRTIPSLNPQDISPSLKNFFRYQSGMQGYFKGNMIPTLISLLCLIIRCVFVIKSLILNSNMKTHLAHHQLPTILFQP